MSDTPPVPAPANSGHRLDFDGCVLAAVLLTMCCQLNVHAFGHNTLAEGKGFATKQLFLSLSDVVLLCAVAYFVVRTCAARAWKRVWLPPLPCWALVFALVLATLHSQTVVAAISQALSHVHGLHPKGIVKALFTKESKEAFAKIFEVCEYFIAAPLLFVNLISDKRFGEVINRRQLAMHVFSVALLLSTLVAAIQSLRSSGHGPHAFFGSPNVYGGFVAMSLPLFVAHIVHSSQKPLPPRIATYLTVALAMVSLVSLWAVLATLLGLALTGLWTRRLVVPRYAGVLVLAAGLTLAAWLSPTPQSANRADFLRIQSATEKVKKQYVEWYAALGWSRPRLRSFATGVGPGNYQFNIGVYYERLPNEEKMLPDSDNLYLVQAVSIGLLGLGALLWMIAHFGKMANLARLARPDDWLGAGVLSSLAAFCAVNLFHALIVRGTGVVLAFLFSLAAIAFQSAGARATTD